jgi:hypothetical protein
MWWVPALVPVLEISIFTGDPSASNQESQLNSRGIRRRENQREGYRRAMQKAEDDKREFNEWTEKTRTAEAEATQKVNSKFPKPRINHFLESWKTQEEKTCKTASAWGRKEKREKIWQGGFKRKRRSSFWGIGRGRNRRAGFEKCQTVRWNWRCSR